MPRHGRKRKNVSSTQTEYLPKLEFRAFRNIKIKVCGTLSLPINNNFTRNISEKEKPFVISTLCQDERSKREFLQKISLDSEFKNR